jgi:hypothetical protein
VGREVSYLIPAARAFGRADELLKGLSDPIERMKLAYAYGRALFRLSEGRNLGYATEGRDRLASALALARRYMPDGVSSAEEGLAAVLEGLEIDRQIADLFRRIARPGD